MAISAPSSFSYAPKVQPALAALAPVEFGAGLKFSKSEPLVLADQNLSAPSQGYWQGRTALVENIAEGALTALGKVADAYTTDRQKKLDKKETEEKETLQHKRAIELANIRAGGDDEEENLTRQIKQKQLEKLTKEVDERIEDTVPEGVRKRGFFIDNPDFGKRPEEIVEPALPTQGGASVSPTDAAKALAGIPPVEPQTQEEVFPAQSVGKITLQGKELDLMPVSTQIPPTPPVPPAPPAQPAASAAQEPQQSWSQYEFEDQYAGAPYESLADAKYAADQLKSVGYSTKIVTAGTATKPIFYIEYDRPDEVQTPSAPVTPQGMQVKAIKDVDGKREVTYEPSIPKEQQIEMLKAPLQANDTMLKAIKQIRSIYQGLSPGTGLIGSIMQWIPASDAADVRNLLKALKGNIAFKALADMRKASPTGGAVGAVSERELGLLESTLGAIDADLSEFLFTQNLNEIERILTEYNKGAAQKIKEIEQPQNFQSIQSPESRIKITSKEEWDKLKPGQKYDFNGSLGTKK